MDIPCCGVPYASGKVGGAASCETQSLNLREELKPGGMGAGLHFLCEAV